MKHLVLFEEFDVRELVEYEGSAARVISKDGKRYKIAILRGNKGEKEVDEDDIKPFGVCLGRCKKEIIGKGKDRHIYCSGCDRKIKAL